MIYRNQTENENEKYYYIVKSVRVNSGSKYFNLVSFFFFFDNSFFFFLVSFFDNFSIF